MNVYLQSVILGIVEGLTEFLPVSSTAHLRITEAAMHISLDDAYWKMYSIVIQAGAILALLLLYLARIVEFLRTFPRGEDGDRRWWNHPLSLTIAAFIATAIPALALKKWSDHNLGSITVMSLSLLIGGIVMWVIDVWASRTEPSTTHVEQMGFGQALWIGLCQSLAAILPGVSRSMSTIASGQIVGLDRPAALEFSFLLSIPTMLAATGYDLLKSIHPGKAALTSSLAPVAAPVTMTGERWLVLAIGFFVSFLVALGVVEWFLHWVRRHGFTVFAIYRIVVGIALLLYGSRFLAS